MDLAALRQAALLSLKSKRATNKTVSANTQTANTTETITKNTADSLGLTHESVNQSIVVAANSTHVDKITSSQCAYSSSALSIQPIDDDGFNTVIGAPALISDDAVVNFGESHIQNQHAPIHKTNDDAREDGEISEAEGTQVLVEKKLQIHNEKDPFLLDEYESGREEVLSKKVKKREKRLKQRHVDQLRQQQPKSRPSPFKQNSTHNIGHSSAYQHNSPQLQYISTPNFDFPQQSIQFGATVPMLHQMSPMHISETVHPPAFPPLAFAPKLLPASFMNPPPSALPEFNNAAFNSPHMHMFPNMIPHSTDIAYCPAPSIPNAPMVLAAILCQLPDFFLLSKFLDLSPQMQANTLLTSPQLWPNIRDQICMLSSLGIELSQLPDFGIHAEIVQACLNYVIEQQNYHPSTVVGQQLITVTEPFSSNGFVNSIANNQNLFFEIPKNLPPAANVNYTDTFLPPPPPFPLQYSSPPPPPPSLSARNTHTNSALHSSPHIDLTKSFNDVVHSESTSIQSHTVEAIPAVNLIHPCNGNTNVVMKNDQTEGGKDQSGSVLKETSTSDVSPPFITKNDPVSKSSAKVSAAAETCISVASFVDHSSLASVVSSSTSEPVSLTTKPFRRSSYQVAKGKSTITHSKNPSFAHPTIPKTRFVKERSSSYVIDLSDASDDGYCNTDHGLLRSKLPSRSTSLGGFESSKPSSQSDSIASHRSVRNSITGTSALEVRGNIAILKQRELEDKIKALNLEIQRKLQNKVSAVVPDSLVSDAVSLKPETGNESETEDMDMSLTDMESITDVTTPDPSLKNMFSEACVASAATPSVTKVIEPLPLLSSCLSSSTLPGKNSTDLIAIAPKTSASPQPAATSSSTSLISHSTDQKMLDLIIKSNLKAHSLLKAIQQQSSTMEQSILLQEHKESGIRELIAQNAKEKTKLDKQISTLKKQRMALSTSCTTFEKDLLNSRQLTVTRRSNLSEFKLREAKLMQDIANNSKRMLELEQKVASKGRKRSLSVDSSSPEYTFTPEPAGNISMPAISLPEAVQSSVESAFKRYKHTNNDAKSTASPAALAASLNLNMLSTLQNFRTDLLNDSSPKSTDQCNETPASPLVLEPLGLLSGCDQSESISDLASGLQGFSTIDPLYDFDGDCLQSVSELAALSNLSGIDKNTSPAADFIPLTRTHTLLETRHSISKSHNHVQSNSATLQTSFKSYTSPLSQFRSFQYTNQDSNDGTLHKLSSTGRLDPTKPLCQYETRGGRCSDTTCTGQHFRDMSMSDDELFAELMETSAHLLPSPELQILRQELHAKRRAGSSISGLISTVLVAIRQQETAVLDKNLFLSTKILATKPLQQEPSTSDHDQLYGKFRYLFDGQFSIPPPIPLLFMGLAKLARGDNVEEARYYDQAFTAEEYESMLETDPNNIKHWISYAVSQLKKPITTETIDKHSGNFNASLLILGRALIPNRLSECLWVLYIDLYQRRGEVKDVRELFQQAISFLPMSVGFWWMWMLFERTVDGGVPMMVLKDMMVHLTGSNSRLFTLEKQSEALLTCIIQTAQCLVSVSQLSKAIEYLTMFLNGQTPIVDWEAGFKIYPHTHSIECMLESHQAVVLLLTIHLVSFGFFPINAFYEYPHNYLVKPRFFLIDWNHSLCKKSLDTIETINGLFDSWLLQQSDVTVIKEKDAGIKDWFCSVIRNYCEMQRVLLCQCLKQIESDIYQWTSKDNFTLMNCIQCGLIDNDEILANVDKYLDGSAHSFALVNAICRIAFRHEKSDDVVVLLTNSIRKCFDGLLPVSISASWAQLSSTIELYQYVLGLDLFVSTSFEQAPQLKHTIQRSNLQSSIHLWQNFIILSAISGSEHQSQLTLFENALKSIKNNDSRSFIWMEYIQLHLPSNNTSATPPNIKQALYVFESAVADINTSVPHPFSTFSSERCEFLQPVPLHDNGWTTEFANHFVLNLDISLAENFIVFVVSQYSEIFISPRLLVRLLQAKKFDAARLILLHRLRNRLSGDDLWMLFIRLEAHCCAPAKRQSRIKWLVDQAKRYLKHNDLLLTHIDSLLVTQN
ncbi:hypothetical protein, variant 1 [Batrachochytrium dendrobatidis JEL423]|uniref:Putative zinc-finger domain-containing protein n=2 Tax=Batrachochytrium dendrobatidis (strain JEL423) TaxID=403673 RepID=A0A177WKP2_BATDL|nr:hypothetical protein, variant 1 [Batrachochytrium dendrobatidis JEL423]